MLRERIQIRILIALFVVMTFVAAPLSVLGQKISPVAPGRAQVEAVVREAYEKFKNDPGGKNADYIPFLAQVEVRKGDYERIFDQARRRVRSWEAAHVK